jgi:hypothetical protein
MDKFVVEVGGVYVKANDGPFIRVVEQINDNGEVHWRDFGRDDGEPIGWGRCSLYAFQRWAGRPATDEERRRLRWDRAIERDQQLVRGLLASTPDMPLHEEHRRRNLASLYHEDMLASEEQLRAFLRKVPDKEIVLEYKRRGLGPPSSSRARPRT